MIRRILLSLLLIVALTVGLLIFHFSSKLNAGLSGYLGDYPFDRTITSNEKLIGKIVSKCSGENLEPSFHVGQMLARENTKSHGSRNRFQIERLVFSKLLSISYTDEQLVRMRLFKVYLGKGDYGISAAAITIYGKSVKELSEKETIAITSLIQAPNQFRNNPEKWQARNELLRECYAKL